MICRKERGGRGGCYGAASVKSADSVSNTGGSSAVNQLTIILDWRRKD